MRHAIQHEESQVLHFTGQQMLPGPLTGSGCCAIASGRGSRAASSAATAPAYTAAAAGKGPATTAASRSSHAAPVAAAPAAASSGLASTATATDRNSAAPGTATASSGSWIQGQAGTSKACEDSLDERGGKLWQDVSDSEADRDVLECYKTLEMLRRRDKGKGRQL